MSSFRSYYVTLTVPRVGLQCVIVVFPDTLLLSGQTGQMHRLFWVFIVCGFIFCCFRVMACMYMYLSKNAEGLYFVDFTNLYTYRFTLATNFMSHCNSHALALRVHRAS